MSVEASKNPSSRRGLQPSGCPRCAIKLDRPYKYCPNCSYRLRPDLVRHHPTGAEPIRQAQRLLAIGGYLGFVSLLLLLVLTGLRLFENDPMPPEEPLRRINVTVKTVEFGPDDLQPVTAGEVSWGAYRRVDSTGVFRDLLRRMPPRTTDEGDPARTELDEWADRMRTILEEQTRALLPDLFRVDDPFSLGVAEITNEQWYAFLHARAKKCGKPAPADYHPASWTRSSPDRLVPRIYPAAGPGKPVADISFLAALEFCNWVWEEVLGADPELIVDLPTALEFARAGRGDSLDNFPWGRTIGDLDPEADPPEQVNLSGPPLPTRDPKVGLFRGLFGQVGNVAEWIHFQAGSAAAGWSYLGSPRSYATERGESTSPFSTEELEFPPLLSDHAAHIGFRIAVRHAPSLPRFAPVTAGAVQFVARPNPVMPPEMLILDPVTGDFTPQRLPPIQMPAQSRSVPRDFAMADTEITNRQYLAFLVEEAARITPEYAPDDTDEQRRAKDEAALKQREELLPQGFAERTHPFLGRQPVFAGPYGSGDAIRSLFEAGTEAHPVWGVTPEQAEAYAAWLSRKLGHTARLPTAAEYVRAGRGDDTTPYPWGDSTGKWELICEGRADDQDRPRSLYTFLRDAPGSIQGLCGNVLELVTAPEGAIVAPGPGASIGDEWLLAGGCYEFEAEACTLDSFLARRWIDAEVERAIEPDADGVLRESYTNRLSLAPLTGFRVVLEGSNR